MTRNRIVGTVGALALLAAPAAAIAHGDGHHHKHHGKKSHKRVVANEAKATIASFTDGELTLALPNGKTYAADVTRRTIIVCRTLPTSATTASRGDDDHGSGRGGRKHGHDDPTTTAPASTTVPPTTTTPAPAHVPSGGDGHRKRGRCGTAALVVGAKVAQAKLSLKGDSVVWKKLTIVR